MSAANRIFAIALAAISICSIPSRARAWDSRTHRMITRLAIDALPESPLKQIFEGRSAELQNDAVAPDEVLRPRFGKVEAIRHYIDLEYYGADPFAELKPDRVEMEREYGRGTLERSGTLPWTIEQIAHDSQDAWRKGDCPQAILLSGLLAHYVGDASQPLHTTKYYDGYPADRGIHARLEGAADRYISEIEAQARPQVHVSQIDSAWTAAIGELRHSNTLVWTTLDADRAARGEAGMERGPAFDRALMRREQPMIARQIAEAASVLASIWMYEWKAAGAPAACGH